MTQNARIADDLRLNAVWVIESLRPDDQQTGVELHDAVLLPLRQVHKHLRVELSTPTSKAEFFALLTRILEQCQSNDLSPILHLEAHGGRHGIQLTSNEIVTWEELRVVFTDINIATKFNLLVVLAACKGAHLVSLLKANDRAPMWGLIGPASLEYPHDLLADYSAFYQTLLTGLKGYEAVKALNAAAKLGRRQHIFYSATYMFVRGYEHYKKVHGNPLAVRRRAKKAARTVAKGKGKSLRAVKNVRHEITRKLRDHKTNFRPYAEKFFMHDLIPTNVRRYPIDALL